MTNSLPIFDFEFLELDPRQGRHERFLRDFEFDACELSFSSYVVAVEQGPLLDNSPETVPSPLSHIPEDCLLTRDVFFLIKRIDRFGKKQVCHA